MTDISTVLKDGENIDMPAFRAWLTNLAGQVEDGIGAAALASMISVIYATRAELNADLAHDADSVALVYDDPTDTNNDLYLKTGASGAGAWTLTGALTSIMSILAQPYVDEMEALNAAGEYAGEIVGKDPIADTAQTWSNIYIALPTPVSYTGEWRTANLALPSAQTVSFSVYNNNGNGTLTRTATITKVLPAGVNEDIPVGLPVVAGQHVGVRCSTGPRFVNPGTYPVWYSATEIITNKAYTVSSNIDLQFSANIAADLRAAALAAKDLLALIGTGFESVQIGDTAVAVTGQSWTTGIDIIDPHIVSVSGYVTSVDIAVVADCEAVIGVVTQNGDGTFTKTANQTVSLAAGANLGVPVFLPISSGQYVTFRPTSAPHFTNPGTKNYKFAYGVINENTAVTTSGLVSVEFGATVKGDIAAKLDQVGATGPAGQFATALAPLVWTALGTSITAQNQYFSRVAADTTMTSTNLGVGGASIGVSTLVPAHYGSEVIYNQIPSIPTDTDFVTIEAGINDFAANETALGQLGDTTTATFYGALYAAVDRILNGDGPGEDWQGIPTAKIIFLTPYAGGPTSTAHYPSYVNGQGNTLDEFQRAVEEVAAYTGWPCFRAHAESGIGYFTAAANLGDGLHLNAAGGRRYADFLIGKLLTLHNAGYFD